MAADSVFDGGGEVAGEQRPLAGLAGESGAAPADVAGEERSRYGLAGESERAAELAPEKMHRQEMAGQIQSDSVKKGPAVWSSEKKGLSTASPGKLEGVSEETKDPSSSEKKRSPSPRREDRRKCRLGRSRRRREVAPLLRLENRRKWWSRQRKQ